VCVCVSVSVSVSVSVCVVRVFVQRPAYAKAYEREQPMIVSKCQSYLQPPSNPPGQVPFC
jgi:hypothetical protein